MRRTGALCRGHSRLLTYVHIVAEQGEARRRVLVLLLLQRLQQQARERLGGHPGRLPRRHGRGGARDRPDRGRICPARGGRVGRVGRRQAREGRRPPGRLSGGRLARELLLGSAVARPGSERGDRLRQLDRAVASGSALALLVPDEPPTSRRRPPRMAHVRRALGSARAGPERRADGPEHEGALVGADHVAGRASRRQRGRAGGRDFRIEREQRLLRGRRLRGEHLHRLPVRSADHGAPARRAWSS